jgi:hypothetical protein
MYRRDQSPSERSEEGTGMKRKEKEISGDMG